MNEREKKLIIILFGAAFIIVNLFGFTSYNAALQKKQVELKTGADELKLKRRQLVEANDRMDEVDWLAENMPAEGTHAGVRADLVTFTEQSANKQRVDIKKRPRPQGEDPNETGDFRSAVVKVQVNCRDAELYRWLCELQNPKKARAITRLKITPHRDDKTRIDCDLEVTQWFSPISEDDADFTNE